MTSQHNGPITVSVDKLELHILSTVIIILWMFIVGGSVALLERAVSVSHHHAVVPWHLSTQGLPPLLVTLIAQVHTPITAMHLARLAVSALSTSIGQPRTWNEVFHLADRKYAGPVGLTGVVWNMIKQRVGRISLAFCVFSLVSASTLALPVVLQRTYLIKTFDIRTNEMVAFNTLSTKALAYLDAYSQIATGGGGLATGQSAVELFSRTTYLPPGTLRDNSSDDIFFAGDVRDRDVTLPGIRLRGHCEDLGVDADAVVAPGANETLMKLCEEQLGGASIYTGSIMDDLSFKLIFCSDIDNFTMLPFINAGYEPGKFPKVRKHTAFLLYNASYSASESKNDQPTKRLRAGVARCEATTWFGWARLSGRNFSYTDFIEDPAILRQEHGSDPVLSPLSALMRLLGQGERSTHTVRAQLGYMEPTHLSGNRAPPTSQRFAEMMWNGVTHMAASLSILSRTTDTEYEAISYTSVPGYVRDDKFFYGVIGLLGSWVFGLLITTVLFLRRTFCDSMDSYVAARLLVQRPDLFNGVPAGSLAGNKKLLEEPGRVQFTDWKLETGPNPSNTDSSLPLLKHEPNSSLDTITLR